MLDSIKFLAYSTALAFNRTIIECKCFGMYRKTGSSETFNRTIIECKYSPKKKDFI